MKILKIAVAVLASGLAFVADAPAQQYGSALSYTLTPVLAGVTETNPVQVATVTKYEDVSIQVSGKLDAAGTDVTKVKFARSVDGVNYETTPSMIISLTHAGTVTTSVVSNWNIGAVGYLKCVAVTNAAATANLTNLTIRVSTKPSRYGR